MWDNFISFINALLLHAVLLAIMILNIEWPIQSKQIPLTSDSVIQAVALDENQVKAALLSLENEQIQQVKPLKVQKHLVRKKQQVNRKIIKENQRLKRLHQQKQKFQKRLEQLKQNRQQEATIVKQLKQQAEQERQAQAKQTRLAEQQAAHRADETINKENLQGSGTRQRQALSDEVKQRIAQKIANHWVRPYGHYQGLFCIVEIHLQPGGHVVSAMIIRSSGNIIFDDTAIRAVYKASPLPIPEEGFNLFRELEITLRP